MRVEIAGLLAAALAVAAVAAPAQAEQPGESERYAEAMIAWRYRGLELTPAQRKALRALLITEHRAISALVASNDARLRPRFEEARRLAIAAGAAEAPKPARQQTEAQRLAAAERALDRRLKRGSLAARHRLYTDQQELERFGMNPERFASLELDDAQRARLDAVNREVIERVNRATELQLKAGKRWAYDGWRSFALRLRQELRPKIAAVLDDDQRARYDALNKAWDDKVEAHYERWLAQRGEQTAAAAARQGMTPQQLIDRKATLEADAVLRQLGQLPAETAALLRALLRARRGGEAKLARLREGLADQLAGGPDRDPDAAIKAYRQTRRAHLERVGALEKQLWSKLDRTQRALLISEGVLS